MAVISVLSYDKYTAQRIDNTIKAFPKFLKAHKIFVPEDNQKALHHMSLFETDLCVCDYAGRHELAGYVGKCQNPRRQKIPTVLIADEPFNTLFRPYSMSLDAINIVGKIGCEAQTIGKVWLHMARVITSLKQNKNIKPPYTAQQFATALKLTTLPKGTWADRHGLGNRFNINKHGLQPLPKSRFPSNDL